MVVIENKCECFSTTGEIIDSFIFAVNTQNAFSLKNLSHYHLVLTY